MSGSLDGGSLSDTEMMEKDFGWNGVIVEPDPKNYRTLMNRNRRASIVSTCLSSEPHPVEVSKKLSHHAPFHHLNDVAFS